MGSRGGQELSDIIFKSAREVEGSLESSRRWDVQGSLEDLFHYLLSQPRDISAEGPSSASKMISGKRGGRQESETARFSLVAGCRYEGKRYQEGASVPTPEPCLQCRCLEGSLRCRLRVCPRLPRPAPKGCRFRHPGENDCCPELVCGLEEGKSIAAPSLFHRRSIAAPSPLHRRSIAAPSPLHRDKDARDLNRLPRRISFSHSPLHF
jgi:hypothetical protein